MSKYVIDGETLTGIADAMRREANLTNPISPIEMPEMVAHVFEAGKQSEYDRFWDSYQENGKRGNYQWAFAGIGWNDQNFKPKHDIIATWGYSGSDMFHSSEITDLKQALDNSGTELDTSKSNYMSAFIQGSLITRCPKISIENCKTSSSTSYMFALSPIETIEKLVVSAETYFEPSTFRECTKLKNLTVEGAIGRNNLDVHWSAELTRDSLLTILNALTDKTGVSGTWTVTLGETNLAKLSEDDIAVAEQKGWVLA